MKHFIFSDPELLQINVLLNNFTPTEAYSSFTGETAIDVNTFYDWIQSFTSQYRELMTF